MTDKEELRLYSRIEAIEKEIKDLTKELSDSNNLINNVNSSLLSLKLETNLYIDKFKNVSESFLGFEKDVLIDLSNIKTKAVTIASIFAIGLPMVGFIIIEVIIPLIKG